MQPFGADREKVIELLEELGGVTEASVREVSERTGVPEADIWGTGLFYTLVRQPGQRVRVCDGLTCQMFDADQLAQEIAAAGKEVERVSCLGQCDRAPATLDETMSLVTYEKGPRAVTPAHGDLPINLGSTTPHEYAAWDRVRELPSEQILDALEAAGLQGRGGAGFPAHFKWRSVRDQPERERYVVCNADESEPGTFKDREVILRQCHKMLEGLAIAASVVEAQDIYVYIRGEYTNEIRAVEQALAEIPVSLQHLRFHIAKGHGAYICGEETALLESLEGKRGMPRLKPPYPTEKGFRGKPTLIHNVETIACVPSIVLRGGEWFRRLGRTEAGTKLYCLSGHVGLPGVYELPLGVTLDELVEAGGGYVGQPQAFSPGGASSGFLPMAFRDTPLDYKHLADAGSMLGSAGVVVLNDSVDMAQAAAWQTEFFERESCGQCAPCRIGTQYLRKRMDDFLQTRSVVSLEYAEDVGWEMEEGSICGLGMVAAKPLESARRHFPDAFEE